jgi:non-ribosomal peptide synthetase component F
MLNHFQLILEAMVEDSETQIDSVSLLSAAERQQLLVDWNKTEETFPGKKCVHHCFEELAKSQPEAPALTYKKDAAAQAEELTYHQLNEKANQLAHYLIGAGVVAEQAVGICMERSVNMAVAMLAILKAGGAYVPIDPAYPQDRISYMVKDSGLKVLLTQDALKEQLSKQPAQLVSIDGDGAAIQSESKLNPDIPLHPENLAYIIYTSGSTGKPKGTLLHHRGACNLAHLQKKAFNVGPGSRILQFASLSFDAATWEFLMTLLSGSAFVLTSAQTIAAGQELVNLLADQKITTI